MSEPPRTPQQDHQSATCEAACGVPKVFALTRDMDGREYIVGYGLVLPDGSAISVSWPSQGMSFYSTSSAEQVASLRGTDLLWLDCGRSPDACTRDWCHP